MEFSIKLHTISIGFSKKKTGGRLALPLYMLSCTLHVYFHFELLEHVHVHLLQALIINAQAVIFLLFLKHMLPASTRSTMRLDLKHPAYA